MANVVIDLAETVRLRSKKSPPAEDHDITPSETLELVRAYSQIKDPNVRQTALDSLKKIAVTQS